eukprot:CAMPEP_0183346342 /NCGR_PEP_ID=MMETSP0164_2-20130417/11495_1 /TAXON_ID=221442 /ORGANISM="Coccolithus pelagicus ssp braarudi, Strain PLY182g" /LENGTH=37 /DNA_ID= /DNA_START= /DNA_END= /DNA_ORIENTATION=
MGPELCGTEGPRQGRYGLVAADKIGCGGAVNAHRVSE